MNDEITKEYLVLFNGITNAIQELQSMAVRLAMLQRDAEQAYIDRGCPDDPAAAPATETPEAIKEV